MTFIENGTPTACGSQRSQTIAWFVLAPKQALAALMFRFPLPGGLVNS
jgi:hypothetical protein